MGESSDASGVLITSVLFVVLGCIVENGQSSFKLLAALPYTVVLFIVGISLNLIDIHAKGRVARNSIEGIGPTHESIHRFIHTHTLLHLYKTRSSYCSFSSRCSFLATQCG